MQQHLGRLLHKQIDVCLLMFSEIYSIRGLKALSELLLKQGNVPDLNDL